MMYKRFSFFKVPFFLIGIISLLLLGAMPFFIGPGLTEPEPVGYYFNRVFPALPPSEPPYGIAFPNIRFDSPLTFNAISDQNKIVVGQRDGKIYWFDNDRNTLNKNLLADLSNEVGVVWDGGFLGLAIHPDFGVSGSNYFYVFYTTEDSSSSDYPDFYTTLGCDTEEYWGNFLVLERFEVNPVTLTLVNGSRKTLLKLRMYGTTHRGGGLQFGNDGFLYLTTGDQTARVKSQDIVYNLDGGVLRLDVDKDSSKSHAPIRKIQDFGYPEEASGLEYWIPNDNPFPSQNGSSFEEYYTIGHRNPHRMTKDKETGIFYIGEIGENTHEEINVLSKGKNYGWPVYEGDEPGPNCGIAMYNNMAHEPPLVSFPRAAANAIIGGFVYRGTEIPSLYGKYICADYGSGEEIWSVDIQTGNYTLLGNFTPADIISFGEDMNGNMYLLKQGENVNLYTLLPSTISYDSFPQKLSETGVFQDLQTLSVSEGLIPYDLIDPSWSDGALKKRWMAIPNDGSHNTSSEKIRFSEDGDWDFPIGTVLIEHFDLPIDDANRALTKKIETRFSIKGQDGKFYFITYNWNDQQTDAILQTNAADEQVAITTQSGGTRYQNWHYPSNTECIACHNTVSKGSLGPRTRYLNSDFTYNKTNITANQLVTLSHLGILDRTITDTDTPNFLTYKSIYDTNATIDDKARSYLDLNCGYCHRPGTGNRAEFDLRLLNNLNETRLLTAGTLTPLGIEGEKIIVPGDAEKSILYHRINSIEPSIMMPPMAKGLIDDDAVALIHEWIGQLDDATSQPPVAVIGADVTQGFYPLQVSFTGDGSTDDVGVASYLWDFMDGSPRSTEINPVHTFAAPGVFMVELTVEDGDGSTNTGTITVMARSRGNEAPVAVVSAMPMKGNAPLEVSFTGSNSTDDDAVASYLWDFKDGSPTSAKTNPVHTFAVAGTYLAKLTVEDAEGLTNSALIVIKVGASQNGAPVAIINATPMNGNAPLVVNFSGGNSIDNDAVVSYLWDFNDGSPTSSEMTTGHLFDKPGVYEVSLTVTDIEGLSNTQSITIEVVENTVDDIIETLMVNPAKEVARVRLIDNGPGNNKVVTIYLHDSSGRLVRSYKPQDIFAHGLYEVPISTLSSGGIYFIGFEMNKGTREILKLIVQ